MPNIVKQVVLTEVPALNPNQDIERIALYNEDGTEFEGFTGPQGEPGADGEDGADGATGPTGPTSDLVTVATAIGTAAKTTTDPEPDPNTVVPVKFTNGNSASSPTIAFDGGSARVIKLGGTATTGAKITVAADGVVLFWFDGTILHQFGVVS